MIYLLIRNNKLSPIIANDPKRQRNLLSFFLTHSDLIKLIKNKLNKFICLLNIYKSFIEIIFF